MSSSIVNLNQNETCCQAIKMAGQRQRQWSHPKRGWWHLYGAASVAWLDVIITMVLWSIRIVGVGIFGP